MKSVHVGAIAVLLGLAVSFSSAFAAEAAAKPDRILAMVRAQFKLTESQTKQLEALEAKSAATLEPLTAKVNSEASKLKQALSSVKTDTAAFETTLASFSESLRQLAKERGSLLQSLRGILTADQLSQLLEKVGLDDFVATGPAKDAAKQSSQNISGTRQAAPSAESQNHISGK